MMFTIIEWSQIHHDYKGSLIMGNDANFAISAVLFMNFTAGYLKSDFLKVDEQKGYME